MPVLKSSKKRLRQERVRRIRNASIKSAMRTAMKRVRQNTDKDALPERLSEAISRLDKAAKRGVIHKRTAARHKSRLMKLAAK